MNPNNPSHEHHGSKLGGVHQNPPYDIFCDWQQRLHQSGKKSSNPQGVPKDPQFCQVMNPTTLGAYKFHIKVPIEKKWIIKLQPQERPFQCHITHFDALPSPGVNAFEGSPKCSCGKLGLGRRSRLPTLERGRGSNWEPRDQTRKKVQQIKLESAPKQTTHVVSSHFGTPLGVGTSHGHFGPQDTPQPGLGGSHHLPPYSILYNTPPRLHQMALFPGTLKLESRNCPEIVSGGVPKLWELITPDCQV